MDVDGHGPARYGHTLVPVAVPSGHRLPLAAPVTSRADATTLSPWKPLPSSPFIQTFKATTTRKIPGVAADFGIHHVGVPLDFGRYGAGERACV